MATSEIRQLALAVDDAIAALEQAVEAYLSHTRKANAQHIIDHNQPHPLWEKAPGFVLAAVASRPKLAKTLTLMPVNPGVTIADHHPE